MVYDLTKDLRDLPSRRQAMEARGMRELDAPPDPRVQKQWDIPELVVVTAAVSGRVTREAASGTPQMFPLDFDGFIDAAVEVIEAGACGVHIDFGGIAAIQESGLSVTDCYDKVIGGINAKTSVDWVPDCNCLRGESMYENAYPIVSGLTETFPAAPNFPTDWLQSVFQMGLDHSKRSLFAIHSAAEVDLADRYIYSQGLCKAPGAFWGILIGYQYDDATDRLASHLNSPEAMMDELRLIVVRIREVDPEAVIMVACAGRSANYMATLAMIMGLHIRIGLEDTVWRYPHKDELLETNLEMLERVKQTAEVCGRRLATAAEFRELIDLPAKQEPSQ